MTANTDTELLTEHFGYPPVSLIDDIINSVNILAERALNSVEQGLLNAPPSSIGFKKTAPASSRSQPQSQSRDNAQQQQQPPLTPADQAKDEIESGTHQLETLLCASIDRNFDKFELYVLRNILCVRPADVRDWMRLSHYEGLDFSSSTTTTAGGDSPSLDGINRLRRRLRESMRLNALLTAERARNDAMLDELRDLVGVDGMGVKREVVSPSGSRNNNNSNNSNRQSQSQLGDQPQTQPQRDKEQQKQGPFVFLGRKGDLTDGGASTPFSTTTAFTLSQMQALRALSTSLRNVAPDLRRGPADSASSSAMLLDDDGQDVTAAAAAATEEGRKSWRRERLEYVEAATRRHLEGVQGLELGRHGEVRDGEWQGEGRNLARGEVEGLERVVSLLGGGGSGDDGDASTAAAATDTAATAGETSNTTSPSKDRTDRMDES